MDGSTAAATRLSNGLRSTTARLPAGDGRAALDTPAVAMAARRSGLGPGYGRGTEAAGPRPPGTLRASLDAPDQACPARSGSRDQRCGDGCVPTRPAGVAAAPGGGVSAVATIPPPGRCL
ncbi:hypothetical protein TPA0909_18870 [Streptomyces albus]|nr:hypothetical protein TPA0909_18870 [Streptomyces albus]